MGLALYRKYRPKSLADIVGQDHIVSTLQKAIKTGAISHAYLLTGPRGVGKTSIARILAHELNGLPYADDATHLDIIEIDAASNRRIDEIRELRDKVHIVPTSAKYKVYIIDEVHMLTREAFNALLKTLEEPPAHAIFILATTEAHKVPETITSRTQRFTFKPITANDTVSHLQAIAKKEAISINADALELLSEHAGGSFRDSINLLDQLGSQTEVVSKETIGQILGIPNVHIVESLISDIQAKDTQNLLMHIDSAKSDGIQAQLLAKVLIKTLRTQVAEGALQPSSGIMQLFDELIRVGISHQPYVQLELALLKNIVHGQVEPSVAITKPAVAPHHSRVVKTAETPITKQPPKIDPPIAPEEPLPVAEPQPPELPNSDAPIQNVEDYWPELLKQIKSKHNTLYGVLRMAHPVLQDDTLTLTFGFAFHQKKINQADNVQHISETVSKILGKSTRIICVLGTEKKPTATHVSATPTQPTAQAQNAPLNDVADIFAGAELLE